MWSTSSRLPSILGIVDETRWDEKAGLRRDAIRSQVIDALEAQEIKETGLLIPSGYANYRASVKVALPKLRRFRDNFLDSVPGTTTARNQVGLGGVCMG